jgi:hypothetical protein
MKKANKHMSPIGIAPQQPENFAITAAAISAAAAIGKVGFDAGRALHSHYKSDTLLFFQVMDSKVVNGQHSLDLDIVNASPHGIYLEWLTIDDPKGTALNAHIEGEFSKPSRTTNINQSLPALIRFGQTFELTVRFDLLEKKQFEKRPYVKFHYGFSELGGTKKEKDDAFVARVRW